MASRRFLLTLALFVLCFYVLPVQAMLRTAFAPVSFAVPTAGLAGLPDLWRVQANLGLMLVLAVGYGLLYLLTVVILRLSRAYGGSRALAWLHAMADTRGIHGLDDLLLHILPLMILGFGVAIPFWRTEGTVMLLALTWLSLVGDRATWGSSPALGSDPQSELSDLDAEVPDGDVHKEYTWALWEQDEGRWGHAALRFSVKLSLSQERYQAYRGRSRALNVRRWSSYVTADIPEVTALANALLALGREQGLCTYEQACNVLAFVQQCIRPISDRPSEMDEAIPSEHPRYPIESLMEETGSDADRAILAAALLSRMGYRVALLICPDRIAVGIAGAEGFPGTWITDPITGTRYLYGEARATGWLLDELPEELAPYWEGGRFAVITHI